jgi:small subunit ribosomal protein S2
MSSAVEVNFQELTEEKAMQLLEAGVHFGQPTSKRSPKMDEFVYGTTKSGMQIIDLNQTWKKLQEAGQVLQKLISEDKNVVFVGTNERAVSTVLHEYSEKYDLHHIASRWLGGTLTNPVTRNRINYLRELEGMEQSGLIDSIPAKEKSFLSKKLKKLRKNLGGLKKIKGAMHAIVLIDPEYEVNATLEAFKKSKNLTIIAVADTNCHFTPENFDVIIPCNTSSLRSLKLVMDELVKYIELGKQQQTVRSQSSFVAGPNRRSPQGGNRSGNGPRRNSSPSNGGAAQATAVEAAPEVQTSDKEASQ